jgi:TATA-box binding protein (TBP) (component of TFIID and TFIIIB)
MLYKITNIKISVKTTFICLNTVIDKVKCMKHKRYNNFVVLRNIYTYVIFKSGKNNINHINITKVKTFCDIEHAINHLLNILCVEEIKRTVDNITVSLNINRKVNLNKLPVFENCISISYNSEKFPGAFIKFNCGTIILFHTGKCIFIGIKKREDIECLISKVVHI